MTLTEIDNLDYEEELKEIISNEEFDLTNKELKQIQKQDKNNVSNIINYNKFNEIKFNKSNPEKLIQKKLKRIEKLKDHISNNENYLNHNIRNLVIDLNEIKKEIEKDIKNNKDSFENKNRLNSILSYNGLCYYTEKIIESKSELNKLCNLKITLGDRKND